MYNFKTLYEATSVAEALKLKADHPEALFLAGGSDILIKIREGRLDGVDLINIYMLDELRGICLEDDGSILIRPLTSFTDVAMHPVIKEHLPVLGEAVNTIGGPQVRNIGTIGGNICNGVPSADSAITLKAYDATLEIVSTEGTRILPYADFNLGFGKVDLGPTELHRHPRVFGEREAFKGQASDRPAAHRLRSRRTGSGPLAQSGGACQGQEHNPSFD